MRVEIDPAELEGAFYRDEKCREVEESLRQDSRYKECDVRREFCGEDAPCDPFVIRNRHGETIATLHEWEIDALNGYELVSYVAVQHRRNQCSDRLESALIRLFLGAVSVTGLLLVISLQMVLMLKPVPPVVPMIFLTSCTLTVCSGSVYFLKRKSAISTREEIDIEAARSDPSFLEALRKLAAVSRTASVNTDEHIERLEHIENTMNGIES